MMFRTGPNKIYYSVVKVLRFMRIYLLYKIYSTMVICRTDNMIYSTLLPS